MVFKLPRSFYSALLRASVIISSKVVPGRFSLQRYGIRGEKPRPYEAGRDESGREHVYRLLYSLAIAFTFMSK